MIYCVIATDPKNGNEWVMPDTAETIVEIGAHLDRYRENDPRFQYRLDVVGTPANQRERVAFMNEMYAKHPHVYASTDSMRTQDFALKELFGEDHMPLAWDPMTAIVCRECGSLVMIPQRHVDWHNKLLP